MGSKIAISKGLNLYLRDLMMNLYLVKYTPEIGTKQFRSMQKFSERLAENIREGIAHTEGREALENSKVKANQNHVTIRTPSDLSHLLQHIPGIKYFTQATERQAKDFDQLVEEAHEFFRPYFKDSPKYAVKCRKTGGLSYSKKDVEIELGNHLVQYGKTDLSNPELTCHIEIRENIAFFYTEKTPGMQGLPLGTQGKALTLFSGGIDSPVAAWRTYRIGLDQDFVYFHLGGEKQKEIIMNLYRKVKGDFGHGSRSKLIIVDFLPVIEELLKARKSYQNLLLKFCFYKASERLTNFHNCETLVTGESIGQVSTQTSRNLATLDRVADIMILRPLSTAPKDEISAIAKQIGTYDLSHRGKEFCALATKKVNTGTSLRKLMNESRDLSLIEKIEQVTDQRELWTLDENGDFQWIENPWREKPQEEEPLEVDTSITPENANRVIDLRDTNEMEKSAPYGAEHIPFDQAWEDYFHWDKAPTYYLLCNYGSKSKIMAHYMRKEGFKAGHLEGGLHNNGK